MLLMFKTLFIFNNACGKLDSFDLRVVNLYIAVFHLGEVFFFFYKDQIYSQLLSHFGFKFETSRPTTSEVF